ncbi:hypothetical protein PpBr36_03915 [Pyricularia pennisetigena]|uniref:hypothetical protein n=1 Tax=Pyricularia pennisetigena TaxID=1578925 RepID=UPI00114D8B02|nr:hypothetical protein PpBr36_03915 [Pyricularia pennisetigena]TLS30736.1 hypothetical protein PpBr36_03915 [Pyricularia pennisetigena]
MPSPPLTPDDDRVTHHSVPIDNLVYHYIQSLPAPPTKARGTIFLLHGWPDTALTWRYTIPFLTSPPLSLRVVAPDMLGYGGTSAPEDPAEYSLKRMSMHMRALVKHVMGQQEEDEQPRAEKPAPVLLAGHDWGAALAWRMVALWTPGLFSGVACLNVPYLPPDAGEFVDMEAYVAAIPSLRYQLQLSGDEAVSIIDDASSGHANLRGFLNGIYDGRGPNGEESFTVDQGVRQPEVLRVVGPAKLMREEWVDYYVAQFAARSFRGPTNWYRTRKVNYDDEKGMSHVVIRTPSMVVMGKKDDALPPALADGMEKWFGEGLLRKEVVDAGHWAHWEEAEKVNSLLGEFFGHVLDG